MARRDLEQAAERELEIPKGPSRERQSGGQDVRNGLPARLLWLLGTCFDGDIRRGRFWRAAAGLIAILATGLLGCGRQTPGPSGSQNLWQRHGSDSYRIVVKTIGGPGGMETQYRIRVVDGKVVWAERRNRPRRLASIPFEPLPPGSEELAERYTVAGLFERVERLRDRDDPLFDLTVDFHPTLGYPRRIVRKPRPGAPVLNGYSKVEVISLRLGRPVDADMPRLSQLMQRLARSMPDGWHLTDCGICDAPRRWSGKTRCEYITFRHDTLKFDQDGTRRASFTMWLTPKDYAGHLVPSEGEQASGAQLYGETADHFWFIEGLLPAKGHWDDLERVFEEKLGLRRLPAGEAKPEGLQAELRAGKAEWRAGEPVALTLWLFNGGPEALSVPSTYYLIHKGHGAAFRSGMFVHVAGKDGVELKPRSEARFKATESRIRALQSGERVAACTFDLRDWFDLSPGSYRVWMTFATKLSGFMEGRSNTVQVNIGRPDGTATDQPAAEIDGARAPSLSPEELAGRIKEAREANEKRAIQILLHDGKGRHEKYGFTRFLPRPVPGYHLLSAEEGLKLLDVLIESGFFERARALDMADPHYPRQTISIRVHAPDRFYEAEIGWGRSTVRLLEKMRAAVHDGTKAARAMDALLDKVRRMPATSGLRVPP